MNRTQLTLAITSCLVAACGSGTEGRIVEVDLVVVPQAEPDRELGEFETDTGWEVTLERAELALAAMYMFAPEQERGVMAWLSDALVPVARAHGGHDPLSGKRVRAELIEPLVLDLLDDEPRALGPVDAEAGEVVTLAVDIAQPDAEVTDALDGYQVYVEGSASRQGETIAFAGGLRLPDDGLTRRVESAVETLELRGGETLVVGVRPSVWLRDAEFERLEPAAENDAARQITADSQVGRAWFIGARSPAAFSLSEDEEGER